MPYRDLIEAAKRILILITGVIIGILSHIMWLDLTSEVNKILK